MDVQRTDLALQKKRKRALLIGAALAAVILVSIGLAQLEPAAPTVEGGALYFSNVERGEMLRQVRGPGTLVPESLQWITAATQGRVERILVLPGTVVESETVLARALQSGAGAADRGRHVRATGRRGRLRDARSPAREPGAHPGVGARPGHLGAQSSQATAGSQRTPRGRGPPTGDRLQAVSAGHRPARNPRADRAGPTGEGSAAPPRPNCRPAAAAWSSSEHS